jgi:S1-C subfamily serine protease
MGGNVNGRRVPGKTTGKAKGNPPARTLARGSAAWQRPGAAGIIVALLGAIVALLGAVACSGAGPSGPATPGGQPSGQPSAATFPAASPSAPPASGAAPSGPASSLQQQYEQVVSRVLPSVVQISTSEGSGSGVVYDAKGDIVTNAHVVGTATTLEVGLASGGRPLEATVVGVFAPDDLAVIRVRAGAGAGALHPASFGRSAAVRVGEIVLAMGNPLGLTGTVTEGIVSATGRTVSEGQGTSAVLISAIQTSAPINPGNSGGALVNLAGQVIGIPTLAVTSAQLGGAAAGIGFAIPSDTVTAIAAQLITAGKVTSSGRASLGITAQTVADAAGQPAGAGIVTVAAGGAAARAGIQPGDIIMALAGQPVPSVAALQSALAARKPGDRVQARVSRGGTQATVTVTLGSLTS